MKTEEITTEVKKEKRKYKKIQMDLNQLTKLIESRSISWHLLAEKFDVTTGTAKKYIIEPKLLNGYQRSILSEILNIEIRELNAMID